MSSIKSIMLPAHKTVESTNMDNLDKFLEDDKQNNINDQWCKLNKTVKLRKMQAFADTYAEENGLDEEEKTKLFDFLKECLDKKKLLRVKDVVYDKVLGVIKEIPSLHKAPDRYTLKNMEKRISTLKNLPVTK